jgi:hypothetical protein
MQYQLNLPGQKTTMVRYADGELPRVGDHISLDNIPLLVLQVLHVIEHGVQIRAVISCKED